MPNFGTLTDCLSQWITDYKTKPSAKIFLTTIDLKYAYFQLNPHSGAAKHWNFNIVSGNLTGTYRFKTGFYGLTDMPAKFLKAMDYTLIGLRSTFCFLDDILTVRKKFWPKFVFMRLLPSFPHREIFCSGINGLLLFEIQLFHSLYFASRVQWPNSSN